MVKVVGDPFSLLEGKEKFPPSLSSSSVSSGPPRRSSSTSTLFSLLLDSHKSSVMADICTCSLLFFLSCRGVSPQNPFRSSRFARGPRGRADRSHFLLLVPNVFVGIQIGLPINLVERTQIFAAKKLGHICGFFIRTLKNYRNTLRSIGHFLGFRLNRN